MRLPPPTTTCRRTFVALAPLLPSILLPPLPASASRPFSEPRFSLLLPDGYAISKRTATSGTLFVAGNFPRASVVSVSAWPLPQLLAEEQAVLSLPGEPASLPGLPPGGVNSLDDAKAALGTSSIDGLTRALLRKRDRESSSGALTSVLSSSDLASGRLSWTASTELSVADPEELYKQRGVRQLIRKTVAVSVLGSVPGENGGKAVPAIFSCFATVLESDFDELGPPLVAAVQSFEVL